MAQTGVLHFSERDHVAMLLVNQYPFLRAGNVTIFIKITGTFIGRRCSTTRTVCMVLALAMKM